MEMDLKVTEPEYKQMILDVWGKSRLKTVVLAHEKAWYYKGALIAVYNSELGGGSFIFTPDSVWWD